MTGPNVTQAQLLQEIAALRQRIAELEAGEGALHADQVHSEAARRYQIIVDLMSDYAYSYRVEPDNTIVHEWITLDSFIRITGFTPEELDQRDVYALYHPDDIPAVRHDIARVLAGHASSGEYRIITKSGAIRWVAIDRRPIWDPQQNRVVRLYGVARDITEHKQMEGALRENEERMRAFISALPDPIFVLGEDGTYVEVLAGQADMLYASREELLGRKVQDVLPEGPARQILDTVRATVATGQAQLMEYRLDVLAGPTWFEGRTALLHDNPDQGYLVAWIAHNISERKLAEEQRLELALEKERNETFRTLVSNIAHDIKTPLTTIKSSLYLLEKHPDPQKRQAQVQVIAEQVRTLTGFVQNMMSVARLDGEPELRLTLVNLNEMIMSVEAELRPVIESKGIAFTLDLAPDLPLLHADQVDIKRMVLNLADNAITYTPDRQSVTITTRRQANDIFLRVIDTGVGISASDLPHLFDRFYRSDNARSIFQSGSGLGLAIARRVAEMHGGQIEVESKPGQGSTFTVRLPLRPLS